ncbi:uncharacterized protein EI90DRAFT_2943021 [Cantharellus anzutake]|uniref:uncharacterized protein n=1 Tax=Cantharellus anzutake TaxID=1750568 RepID=UPI0019038C8F|nr:uncharacterized protein EI90DRAFT_2943021 [Cantharellus anzutake]KAF8317771.1 hypothetical protein EI90DRAFT_2943021 [Cantharellus anzutake]
MGGEEEDEDEDTSFETKCEWGLTKCGILNSEWKNQRQTFECVDANSSLDSCGGCVVPYASRSPGPIGVDCTSIVGVSDVECIRGACIVRRCAKGWDIQPVDVRGGGGGNNNNNNHLIGMECVPHQTREEMTRDVPSKISPQLFDDLKRAPDF